MIGEAKREFGHGASIAEYFSTKTAADIVSNISLMLGPYGLNTRWKPFCEIARVF